MQSLRQASRFVVPNTHGGVLVNKAKLLQLTRSIVSCLCSEALHFFFSLEPLEAGHLLGLPLLATNEREVPSGLLMRHAVGAVEAIVASLIVAPVVLVLDFDGKGGHAV